jgi:hypothetical protein
MATVKMTANKSQGICLFNELECANNFDVWLDILQNKLPTTKSTVINHDGIQYAYIPVYGHKKISAWFFAILRMKGLRR